MAKLLILLALAAVAVAQIPIRCKTPAQFEGRLSRWDHGQGEHFVGGFSYDGENERFAMVEQQQAGKTGSPPHGFIFLYKAGIMYDIDFKMRKCASKPIPETQSWRAWGIPDNATFVDEYTEGVLGEGFVVSEWQMQAWQHPKGWMWVGSFTLNECVPIHEVVFSNVSDSITTHYYDMSLGLTDPDVFIPPSYCK